MACQDTGNEGVVDLGSTIGYTETSRGNITITLTGGKVCERYGPRNTKIFLR